MHQTTHSYSPPSSQYLIFTTSSQSVHQTFALKRDASACTSCAICTKACPVGLPVHTATTIKHADCMSCLECVGECPREGALELKLGMPVFGK